MTSTAQQHRRQKNQFKTQLLSCVLLQSQPQGSLHTYYEFIVLLLCSLVPGSHNSIPLPKLNCRPFFKGIQDTYNGKTILISTTIYTFSLFAHSIGQTLKLPSILQNLRDYLIFLKIFSIFLSLTKKCYHILLYFLCLEFIFIVIYINIKKSVTL